MSFIQKGGVRSDSTSWPIARAYSLGDDDGLLAETRVNGPCILGDPNMIHYSIIPRYANCVFCNFINTIILSAIAFLTFSCVRTIENNSDHNIPEVSIVNKDQEHNVIITVANFSGVYNEIVFQTSFGGFTVNNKSKHNEASAQYLKLPRQEISFSCRIPQIDYFTKSVCQLNNGETLEIICMITEIYEIHGGNPRKRTVPYLLSLIRRNDDDSKILIDDGSHENLKIEIVNFGDNDDCEFSVELEGSMFAKEDFFIDGFKYYIWIFSKKAGLQNMNISINEYTRDIEVDISRNPIVRVTYDGSEYYENENVKTEIRYKDH